ncbi:MAG: electron transport complex subunit RsxG [Burkholderiales bacterium]|nr:electron transport complex subunit RsxG [Burkholderiales bacterium]
MKLNPLQISLRTAFVMLAFSAIMTALLAFTFAMTRDLIAKSEEQEKLALIEEVLPASLSDNDLLKDSVTLAPDPLLGNTSPITAYRARLKGKPSAAVLEAIAPDGYGGKISLLVAILADGEISGVRVVSQNETPGLGDYIEIAKSKWITLFDRLSLQSVPDAGWHVKKDGGRFDYMTGATVTPRAVVKAVHKALLYFSKNRETIFGERKDHE